LSAFVFHRDYPVVVDSTREQTVRVERPSSAVLGAVSEGPGRPVRAFAVVLMSADGVMVEKSVFNPDGTFRAEVTPGNWMLHISAPGLLPAQEHLTLAANEEQRAFVALKVGRVVRGTVVDRQTKRPIAGAYVHGGQRSISGAGFPESSADWTREDGAFTLRSVPDTRFEIVARARGYAERSLPVGTTDHEVQVELAAVAAGATPVRDFEGIGATLGYCSNGSDYCVSAFTPGGGAKSAGLQEGDQVVAIDGKPIGDEDLEDVIYRIRGPAGTLVHLSIRRGDATLEFNVVRRLLRQE
jgi:hypothetical protein